MSRLSSAVGGALAAAGLIALAPSPAARAARAATATWNGGAGNWNAAANWAGGIPNSSAFDVLIDGGTAGNSAVTLDISPTINSLVIDAGDALTLKNGTTLTTASRGTVNGTLTFASTGTSTALNFTGPATLSGSGQVVFGVAALSSNNRISGSGSLTIASGLSIRNGATSGIIEVNALTNQGVISAETAGQTLTVSSTSVTNSATLRAAAGGTLTITNGMTGSGTVQVDVAGTFRAPFIRQDVLSITGTPGKPASFGKAVINLKSQGGQTSVLKSLAIANDGANHPLGIFDLTDNALWLDYAGGASSPLAAVRALLASGYAGGTWTGPGLASSRAAADSSKSLAYAESSDLLGPAGGTFANVTVDGTAILVRYALAGDADFNNTVGFPDLVVVAQRYDDNFGNATWRGGDFNYDGNVNFADLVAVAQNYDKSLPGEAIPGAPAGFQEDLARAFTSVPEPAPWALGGVAAIAASCSGRRRRMALR
jgi:hypothetical protein